MIMPSLSTLMTRMPTIVPPMVPRPPDMEVPPSTTEAMAFISHDSPVAGCAARSWLVMMMPAMAAHTEENT